MIATAIAANPNRPADALLELSVLDPACGSGHFLLAAGRRLASSIAQHRAQGTPSAAEYRHALRQVVGRCLFGVDLNPLAVELCRVSLWMEALEPGRPLTRRAHDQYCDIPEALVDFGEGQFPGVTQPCMALVSREPALGTKLNLAHCEEERGRVATAWNVYRAAVTTMSPEDSRRAVAEERIAALEPRVPRVRFVLAPGAPATTTVTIVGLEPARVQLGSLVPLDPGKHRAMIHVPARPSAELEVVSKEGQIVEIVVSPPERPHEVGRARSAPQTPKPAAPADRSDFLGVDQRTAAYVVGGIGVVGLLVGTVTGLVGLQKEGVGDRECSDRTRTCSQEGYDANQVAKSMATVSTAGSL